MVSVNDMLPSKNSVDATKMEYGITGYLYPHSTRRRSMAICAIWKSATDRIVLG